MEPPTHSLYNGHGHGHYRPSYRQNHPPYLEHPPFLGFQLLHSNPYVQGQGPYGPYVEAVPPNLDVGICESGGDVIDHDYHSAKGILDNDRSSTPLAPQQTENKGVEAVKARAISGRVTKNRPPPPPSTGKSTEERKRQNANRERARRAQMKEVETFVFALVPELRGSTDFIQKQKLERCSEWMEEMTQLNAELEQLLED